MDNITCIVFLSMNPKQKDPYKNLDNITKNKIEKILKDPRLHLEESWCPGLVYECQMVGSDHPFSSAIAKWILY